MQDPRCPKPTFQDAIKILARKLQTDKGYLLGWKANIAMAFKDEYENFKEKNGRKTLSKQDVHEIANAAADHFLQQLFLEVDKKLAAD